MKTGKFLRSSVKLCQLAAFAILLSTGTTLTANAQVFLADSLALVEIYNSTNGTSWSSDNNWLTGPVSTWEGVTVSGNRVKELYLPFNNLTGSLPYHIGFLQELTFLELPGNSLVGNIPSALIFLSKLESLNLSENQFTGSVPALLGFNLKLKSLNLASNQLTGPIPVTSILLQKLNFLDLSDNQLSGSIPAALGFLKSLERLHLHNNQISGSIPSSIGLLERAGEIFLFNNKLTGSIPSSIGNLDSLIQFNASNNDLTGSVPASVASMNMIFSFNVSGNEISALPNLSGVPSLIQLRVSDNRLTFEDLEPNKPKLPSSSFYVPQDSVGAAANITLCTGDTLSLTADFTGSLANNRYRWFTTPNTAVTPISASPVLTIANVQPSHSGTYFARCTNTVVTGLNIIRRPVQVTVVGCASGFSAETRVYPTPFVDQTTVRITTENEEALSLTVSDDKGHVVETLAGLKTNHDVEIGRHLKSGLYYLNAAHGDKNEVIRIIKK